jgi:hypothetical protein
VSIVTLDVAHNQTSAVRLSAIILLWICGKEVRQPVIRRVFGQSGHTLSENALFSGILGLFYAKIARFFTAFCGTLFQLSRRTWIKK